MSHEWDVPTQGRNTRDAVAQNVSRNGEEGFLCVAERPANWYRHNRGLAKHRKRICFRVGVDPGCQCFVGGVFLGMLCAPTACQSCNVFHRRREEVALRKLFLRNAFLERLDQNEGVLLSRVEIFSELRRSAQELLKASEDDAKDPPIVASPNS